MLERHVAILGGGITGLTTAYQIMKFAQHKDRFIHCTVFEQDAQFGGKIRSHRTASSTIEQGPDSLFTPKLAGLDILQELALTSDIIPVNSEVGTFVMHNQRLHALPTGIISGIPTDLGSLARTTLLSPFGKLRALEDLVLPSAKWADDVSLGQFLRNRVGDEVVDILAAPMLAGIHAADIDRLSLNATMPMLRKLQERHRSLIVGLLAQKKSAGKNSSEPRQPMFVTLKDGLESLIDRLLQHLNERVTLVPRTRVQHILRRNDGCGYDLVVQQDGSQRTVHADVIVITTPAFAAADMLTSLGIDVNELRSIRYVSTATVVVGYNNHTPSPRISGFLIPPKEKKTLTACTVVSTKWPHSVQLNQTVYRGYVGRDGDDVAVEWDDEALLQTTHSTLEQAFGTLGSREMSRVTRWRNAMPQYDVGHVGRVKKIEEQLSFYPGILLAGAAYRGAGIPDCIKDGTRAATRTMEFMLEI